MLGTNRLQESSFHWRTKNKLRSRRTAFEQLDDRVVLSAAPFEGLSDAVAEEQPLAGHQLDASPQAGIIAPLALSAVGGDVTKIMSGDIYTFTPEDFGILDPIGGSITGVRIPTLPFMGMLMLSNATVTPGQVISNADLMAGNLQYFRNIFQSSAFAEFGFQLQGGQLDTYTFTLYFNTPQVNFINNLYNDILHRDAEANGITHWLQQSANGASNSQIASDLWGTIEHRGIQVDGYYHQFFNRNPDAAGRAHWINQMVAGMSEEAVKAAFMSTVEYQLMYPTSVLLVTAYYEDVLLRAPEANGLNYWTTQINTGQQTIHQVAMNLIGTRERHLILVDSYYEDFLNRAPEEAGRLHWTDLLDSGALNERTFALALFTTIEYYNK